MICLGYLDIIRGQFIDLLRFGVIGLFCHEARVLDIMQYLQSSLMKRTVELQLAGSSSRELSEFNNLVRKLMGKAILIKRLTAYKLFSSALY